jgi:hypothetical protein
MLLAISAAAVLAFLLLPLLMHSPDVGRPNLGIFYFVAVGLGYILVEVAFIQRFVLFLGNPTYALTVVIFLMLLSSGAGSVISRKWLAQTARVWIALLAIILALAIYVWALPELLEHYVGAPFAAKVAISALLLVPLGAVMGMPFPTGLRALAENGVTTHSNSIEWAWAMNAASSVLGSVLAIVIAILFGLTTTLACGAVAYGLALLLSGKLRTHLQMA